MKEHKLSLSVRALHKAEERENIRHYAKQSGSARTSFADLLNQSLGSEIEGRRQADAPCFGRQRGRRYWDNDG